MPVSISKRRRWVLILLAFLLVTGVVLVVFWFQPGQPKYQGKTLHQWATLTRKNLTRLQTQPANPQVLSQLKLASKAFNHFGTNALQFASTYPVKTSRMEDLWAKVWRKLPKSLQTVVPHPLTFAEKASSSFVIYAFYEDERSAREWIHFFVTSNANNPKKFQEGQITMMGIILLPLLSDEDWVAYYPYWVSGGTMDREVLLQLKSLYAASRDGHRKTLLTRELGEQEKGF